jgi:hypothetical protein
VNRHRQALATPRPGVEVLRRALIKGLDPEPRAHERCPRCGGAPAEPDDDQLLTVAGMSREEIHEAGAALLGGIGPPPPQPHARARLMWCPACAKLVPAGAYPAEWMRIIHEGNTRPEDAPPGLLRNLRDQALVKLVRISTGHSETEERWLKANGFRSWINYYNGDGRDGPYRHVEDYWVFAHDDALLGPVLELALSFGWWPEWGGPPPEGAAAAAGVYRDLPVDGDPRPGGDDGTGGEETRQWPER